MENYFSGKLTLPSLIEQGMQKRLWQGKIRDIQLVSHHLIIIISSGGVQLFDFASQNILWEIDCPIHSATFSPDRRLLATYWGFKIYLWDLQQGKFLTDLKSDSHYVTSNIVFLPDGQTIAFAQAKNGLFFYNLFSHQYTHKIAETREINFLILLDDASMMFFITGDETNDKIISIWDLELTRERKSLKIVNKDFKKYESLSRVISPDYKHIVYGHGKTQKVYLYELDSGKNIQVLEDYTENLKNIASGYHSEKIAMAFSNDGTLFAIGNSDRNLNIWNFKNREYLNNIKVSETGDIFSIRAISFSPNNQYIASVDSDNTIKIWDIHSNQKNYEKQYVQEFRAIALSLERQLLATCGQDGIILYDFNSGEKLKKIASNQEYFHRIYFNSKKNKLIACSFGGKVKVWDIASGVESFCLPGKNYNSMAVHPSQELIAAPVKESNQVEIWNVKSKSLIHNIESHEVNNCNVTFSPDGQVLLIEGSCYYQDDGKTVSFWDVNSGERVQTLRENRPNCHWSEITSFTL